MANLYDEEEVTKEVSDEEVEEEDLGPEITPFDDTEDL